MLSFVCKQNPARCLQQLLQSTQKILNSQVPVCQNACRHQSVKCISDTIRSRSVSQRSLAKPLNTNTGVINAVTERQYNTSLLEEPEPPIGKRIAEHFGLQGGYKYPQAIMVLAGLKMYVCCSEAVDYNGLFNNFDMPDSFFTWFILHELHIWLCMVRLTQEGRTGKFVRNQLIKALWDDTKARAKKIGEMTQSVIKNDLYNQLFERFKYSILNYDEGLLGDDSTLAGSVWRVFFLKKDVPAEQIELMVHYIRKQVAHLEKQDSEALLSDGFLMFLPLHGDKIDRRNEEYLLKKLVNERITI